MTQLLVLLSDLSWVQITFVLIVGIIVAEAIASMFPYEP